MLDIKITRTTAPKAKPDESNLGFGKKFTDHMFVMDYTEGEGWHDARIVPYGPFELDPATVVFHYAQEIFEGMKAYRTADDTVQLFRPDCNAKRFSGFCRPSVHPQDSPVEDYIQAVEALVDVDRDWVPHTDGASLYIRPFIFANDVGLGVHASKHYIFCIICAPSGAYYAEGLDPVRIYVEDQYIRAAPGLTGFTKCGGNYAASIKAGELAEERGFSQVLWLDGGLRMLTPGIYRVVKKMDIGDNYHDWYFAAEFRIGHKVEERDASDKEPSSKPLQEVAEEKDLDIAYDEVEEMPEFPGGMSALMDFIRKNLNYDKSLVPETVVIPRVIVQFVIDEEGNIIHPVVLRGVNPALDEEALRVVKLMPKWKPGRQSGKPEKVRYAIPVTFERAAKVS